MAGELGRAKTGWWIVPAVALLVVALDQWTKHLVTSTLQPYEAWAPIPALAKVFTIHYVTNTGAAFGLFQNGSLVIAIIGIVVSLVIVFYTRHLPSGQWLIRLSLGLQLGGALGNLIDRLRVGHVIDFLDFQIWPVFNVADMAIVSGAILLGLLLVFEDIVERRELKSADGAESA